MSDDRWLAFADVAAPDASIVIPVHGKWSLTQQCLRALSVDHVRHSFEVIVVDDCSPDDTGRQLAEISGVVTVTTETNVGFLLAANLGAQAARADVVVFLNNDTIPQAGWLDVLVDLLDADPTIGLAGSMLVGTDGLVQESGGIIWADGTGSNFGRGLPPERPEVKAVRDVDYCSAAAIAVRKAIFDELGGFDSRFVPAYYEDADLCFAVRAAGHRVVVQPESVVIHVEGGSHGAHGAGGLKRFQEVNRHTFVRKWREELTGQGMPDDPAATWISRNRRSHGMVLVVDVTVPTPDRDAGSRRMLAIVDELLGMGVSVHFATASTAMLQPYTADLERKGVTVLINSAHQQQFLREAGPRLDAVLISRVTFAWHYIELAYQHAPDAIIVFDTVDLHSVRGRRQAELEGDRALARQADLTWARESAAILAADVTLVVAQYEKELLAELVPDADVRVLSLVHSPVVTKPQLAGRSGVVFVGGYGHPPNVDAAHWLTATIMPLVWQRVPDVVLSLVGPDLPDELRELGDPRIEAPGWLADLAPVYAATRVVVAPLRYGAGVKGKVAESIEHGVPLVGTTIAVEGIELANGVDVLVADDAGAFADGIVRLLTDDELWWSLAGRAQERLEQFSPKRARAVLEEVLNPMARLAQRRHRQTTVEQALGSDTETAGHRVMRRRENSAAGRPSVTIDAIASELPSYAARMSAARGAISEPITWYQFDILGNVTIMQRLLPDGYRNLDRLAEGLPVADIGAADGDLAFTLEKAAGWEMDIIDTAAANQNGLRGAKLLREQLGSNVQIHDINLDEQFSLPRERYGLVFLLGILYHLQNPYFVLQELARRSHHCILSTKVARLAGKDRLDISDLPVGYLVGPTELNNDSTNYWILSPAGLERLTERAGWNTIATLNLGDTATSTPDSVEADERMFMLLRSRLTQG